MKPYGPLFARVYDRAGTEFANRVAPRIRDYYEATDIGVQHRTLLDVCCGTGTLALFFLQLGYRVVGIDISEDMLSHATAKASQYIQSGFATFVLADATAFQLDEAFGLAVATRDSINHLPDEQSVLKCFSSVCGVLLKGGSFVFDLNTSLGLAERWNATVTSDTPSVFLLNRKMYHSGPRAFASVTGFVRRSDGLYERFDERYVCTVFDLDWVRAALEASGFRNVHFASERDLSIPCPNPEELHNVVVVATK